MKTVFIPAILVLVASSGLAIPNDSWLNITPAVRQSAVRKDVSSISSPFRRATALSRALQDDPTMTVEDRVRAAIGGKNIGGVVFPSSGAEAQVIIKGNVYSPNEEITVFSNDGTVASFLEGLRIKFVGAGPNSLKFEVSSLSTEKGASAPVTVIVPLDEYFRMQQDTK